MSLLWIESCGLLAYSSSSQVWQNTTEYAGSLGIIRNATGGRRGGPSFQIDCQLNDWTYKVRYNFDTTETSVVFGFAFQRPSGTAAKPWIRFYDDGAGDECFIIDPELDGTLNIKDGTDGSILASTAAGTFEFDNVYAYWEFKVTIATSGSIIIKKDGVEVLNETSINLNQAGNGYAHWFEVTSGGYITDANMCDFYICNTSGTTFKDFLGDVKADTFLPEADGANTDYTPSTGSDHYAVIDNAAEDIDISDYLTADTVGYKDSFTTTITGDLPTILAAEITNYDNNPDTGQATCRPFFLISSVEYPGDTHDRGATIERGRAVFEQNPATSLVWTKTALNAAEFGFEFSASA